MSLTSGLSVPKASSSSSPTGPDEQGQQQPSQPGFIATNGNPFSKGKQPTHGQRTPPPASKRIASGFTYDPFAKDQQGRRGPLTVSGDSRHSEQLFTRPAGEDIFHVEGGRADGDTFWYTGVESSGLSDPEISPDHPTDLFSSPLSSKTRPTPRSTLDFGAGDTLVTPFSEPDPRCCKTLQTPPPTENAFSSPLQKRSTTPATPEEQGLPEPTTPLADVEDKGHAKPLARLAADGHSIASLVAQPQAALITDKTIGRRRRPEQAHDLRRRWASSAPTKTTTASQRVRKPAAAPAKRNPGGRGRRRRTQTELLMEAAVRLGYSDVPNVSVVTGGPLVPGPARRRGGEEVGEGEDEAKMRARGICGEIWERRRAKA